MNGDPTSVSKQERDSIMRKWTAPRVIEICVGMEINCYASASL